jgi:hypothetical protein
MRPDLNSVDVHVGRGVRERRLVMGMSEEELGLRNLLI